ncbi:uncharacterized protein BDZ99DRAFT_542497 [Mytilinidion resinicola]|uniref:Uncharacterized protein n=1 Tax=Mytilinidion resinicola TaxID=574789 RepID=A0A6A6Z5A0_9PEZI|nr:uncharacterized protein BDZ99DRAFT_542497 [Mytilinidion resinicola]KAF2816200.1 hypothetical protein BDZ99DRAFT_542497 [Mytilinidion resinicola]
MSEPQEPALACQRSGYDSVIPFSEGSLDNADNEDTGDQYEDLSALEYARQSELTIPYTAELTFAGRVTPVSDQDFETDLQDPIGISLVDLASDFVLKERLTLSKDVAILLKLTCSQPVLPDYQDPTVDDRRRVAQLKLELPLLRSDNEADLRNFGSIAVPKFGTLKLPLELVDDDNDEGLAWPSRYLALPFVKHQEAGKERLQISKEDLLFLQSAMKDSYIPRDLDEMKAEADQYRRVLSDLTNSTAAEGQALDDHLMKMDSILPPTMYTGSGKSESLLPGDVHIGQIYSPLRDLSELPSSSPRKRKAVDLKIEGPLTPPMTLESSSKRTKSVSFSDIAQEFLPTLKLPPTINSGGNLISSQNDFENFFDEVINPRAVVANQRLENEQLQEIDTTRRMSVPQLDFSLPQSPWLEFQHKANSNHGSDETDLASQMRLLKIIQRHDFHDFSSWHGVRRLEKDLPWSPFPSQLGKVALDEEIEDDAFLLQLLKDLSGGHPVDTEALTWKPEGLRILDCTEESDEELEMGNYRPDKDMETLLRKRRLELAEDEEMSSDATRNDKRVTEHGLPIAKRAAPGSKQEAITGTTRKVHEPDGGLMLGGIFSASTALDKFMDMRGKAPKKPNTTERDPNVAFLPLRSENTTPEVPLTTEQSTAALKPTRKGTSVPPTSDNLPPCSFIISAALLTQRYLTRAIQKVYPEVELIERDFEAPNSPAKEADLILSASTGLVLTTLQQIKQRALPGQPDHSSIRAEVLALSGRYEQLVVFVSEGLSAERERDGLENPLDDYDTKALTELKDFCSSMEAAVSIKYVPGGEEALARWIVWAMQRWGISTIPDRPNEMKLLQEETLWELFLRRCGVNAYAAQAILAALKPPPNTPFLSTSESDQNETQVFGLPAFILLSADERVERFQVLLGGNRILNRVSALVDQRWPSRPNGWLFDGSSEAGR